MAKVFDDFVREKVVPERVFEKYRDDIPNQVVEVWENYGFGSINNGYLRIVNPDDFMEVLKDTYSRYNMAIPLFTTGMGDILVWEDHYLLSLHYRKNEVNVAAKNLKFFLSDVFMNIT